VLQRAAPEHAFLAVPLLVGLVAPLLFDSPVDWSHRVMHLYGNQIESVADVTWPSSLMYLNLLNLGGNPLGCFQGVPEHVVMLEYYGKKTTRCPSNCTTATFYDASADACLPCGAGKFVVCVGAVMCSLDRAPSTVTLVPAVPPPGPVVALPEWTVWTCEGNSTATYQAPTSEAGCCKWTGAWDGAFTTDARQCGSHTGTDRF
jgi:hypothetical protein